MLPKENRLTKNTDFQAVYKKGKFFGTKLIHFKYMKNSLPNTRVGFVIGTKVSKSAVKRNKIKRQMRDIFRLKLDNIKKGYDIAVIVKPGAIDMDYDEIVKNIDWALSKIGLI